MKWTCVATAGSGSLVSGRLVGSPVEYREPIVLCVPASNAMTQSLGEYNAGSLLRAEVVDRRWPVIQRDLAHSWTSQGLTIAAIVIGRSKVPLVRARKTHKAHPGRDVNETDAAIEEPGEGNSFM